MLADGEAGHAAPSHPLPAITAKSKRSSTIRTGSLLMLRQRTNNFCNFSSISKTNLATMHPTTFRLVLCDAPSDMIQDVNQYDQAKHLLMFQVAPDCNELTPECGLAPQSL
uniref:Uncharacterized protein n=1 Tax=Romanomermis culicivorax TaxID=13658 RepID=A0A915HVZ0_ROMCU